jgi:hypothetical protein
MAEPTSTLERSTFVEAEPDRDRGSDSKELDPQIRGASWSSHFQLESGIECHGLDKIPLDWIEAKLWMLSALRSITGERVVACLVVQDRS